MNDTRAETLGFLKRFKHSSRTNLAQGRMSNHDALAFIFFKCGTLKSREVVAIMQEWRGYKHAFTYMLNTSGSGGYGFTGDRFESPGQWMYISTYTAHKAAVSMCKKIKGETYFRRHYWYRTKRGHYAPTLECFKRMSELNFTRHSVTVAERMV